MVTHSGGVEENRIAGPKASRPSGAGGTTACRGVPTAQRPVPGTEAIQRANELQRLGLSVITGQPLRMLSVHWAGLALGGQLTDKDRVVVVAGLLQTGPAGISQRPVHHRSHGHP
jgi:hypothetical protein